LNGLARRKASLLLQSAVHRQTLMKEAENVRPVAGWVDLGIEAARKVQTGWSVLAPLLPLWKTPEHQPSGFIHKVTAAISFARSLTAMWKSRR
jgi:hypothetical protein